MESGILFGAEFAAISILGSAFCVEIAAPEPLSADSFSLLPGFAA
jgi:hypothetical protein